MTRRSALTEKDEELIFCKRTIMRLMAIFSLQPESFLSELQVDLNDIESDDKEDLLAVAQFQGIIETYKEALK